MDYQTFIKNLENSRIELFDYEKRQLYYQLTNNNDNNMKGGGNSNVEKFFKCNNKKYIIDSFKNKYFNVKFINDTYHEL